LAGQETLAERSPEKDTDAEFFASCQQLNIGFTHRK